MTTDNPRDSIDFVGGSTKGFSDRYTNERTINFLPVTDNAGRYIDMLRGRDGQAEFTDTSADSITASHVMGDKLYIVALTNTFSALWEIDAFGASTLIGSLSGLTHDMDDNGTELMIACGEKGYIYTVADGITEITAAAFAGADTVVFIDGYFVCNVPNTGRMRNSGLYDGLAWAGLDFATAEGKSDNLVAVESDGRDLWAFGTESTELWYNAGNATGFPFSRNKSVFLDVGCLAKESVVRFNDSLLWLGAGSDADGVVFMAVGYQPQRISNTGIEARIGKFSVKDDAKAYGYTIDGFPVYVLSFPSENVTFVYHVISKLWSEYSTYNANLPNNDRYRGQCYALFNNKHYIGSGLNGKVYETSFDYLDDDGVSIIAERAVRNVSRNNEFFTVSSLEFIFDTGNIEDNSEPVVMLDWSIDNGATFSNERTKSLGKKGERRKRVKFNRLGRSRDKLFRIRISDKVKKHLVGLIID